jgi:hypothetical protein
MVLIMLGWVPVGPSTALGIRQGLAHQEVYDRYQLVNMPGYEAGTDIHSRSEVATTHTRGEGGRGGRARERAIGLERAIWSLNRAFGALYCAGPETVKCRLRQNHTLIQVPIPLYHYSDIKEYHVFHRTWT